MAMTRATLLRLLILLAALFFMLGSLLFVLGAVERLVDLWERSLALSPVLAAGLALLLGLFVAATLWLIWWIMRPPRRRPREETVSAASLEARLARARDSGLDTGAVDAELEELARRREAAELHIALYGQVSMGKSSLVAALLPEARVQTDVRAGTTRALQRYLWEGPRGDRITLTDAPGLNDAAADAQLAREEALRAQIVIYLCDGDLTRDQWQALRDLAAQDKPLIVAINKIDRLESDDLARIRGHLEQGLADRPRLQVVAVNTGGQEEMIRERPDGQEERVLRPRTADVAELIEAIETQLLAGSDKLDGLRDTAILHLASGKLDATLDAQRLEKAEALVAVYTRRAVLGALAAVSPGSDLVIQGALATQFVRELCKLYDAVPRELEIEKLLRSANRRVRRNSAVVLAIAGNGLKAFPGAGTVTGGLMHAVAYGLLFDTLGRAMVHNLRTRGQLRTEPTADVFESLLDEDLLPRARRMASLVLKREGRR